MKYTHTSDSERQPGVPRGVVSRHTFRSQIFSGTSRDDWLYVPARYDAATPAALMVFQDGQLSLDTQFGNWWLANLAMKSAFEFRGYDHRFVGGEGGHDGEHGGEHGGAILPDALRWSWAR